MCNFRANKTGKNMITFSIFLKFIQKFWNLKIEICQVLLSSLQGSLFEKADMSLEWKINNGFAKNVIVFSKIRLDWHKICLDSIVHGLRV